MLIQIQYELDNIIRFYDKNSVLFSVVKTISPLSNISFFSFFSGQLSEFMRWTWQKIQNLLTITSIGVGFNYFALVLKNVQIAQSFNWQIEVEGLAAALPCLSWQLKVSVSEYSKPCFSSVTRRAIILFM